MTYVHFRMAVVKRLGGCLRQSSLLAAQPQTCMHNGAQRVCGVLLDQDGLHASTCPVGGLVIKRHDRIVRWLFKWLGQGRTSSPPSLEQVLPSERGRLDIVFQDEVCIRFLASFSRLQQ